MGRRPAILPGGWCGSRDASRKKAARSTAWACAGTTGSREGRRLNCGDRRGDRRDCSTEGSYRVALYVRRWVLMQAADGHVKQ